MPVSGGFLVFFIINHKVHRRAWDNAENQAVRPKLGMEVSGSKYNAYFYHWLKASGHS